MGGSKYSGDLVENLALSLLFSLLLFFPFWEDFLG